MGIVESAERVSSFFLRQRLDKQIERLDRLEEMAEERGMAPIGQIDSDSAEQGQGDRIALRELEGATDEKLDELFEEVPLSVLTPIAKDWKYSLQKRRHSLD